MRKSHEESREGKGECLGEEIEKDQEKEEKLYCVFMVLLLLQ